MPRTGDDMLMDCQAEASKALIRDSGLPARACGAKVSRRWVALFALTVLAGHIVDRTTGQPLTGVDVSAQGGAKVAPARTNAEGQYTLRGLAPGHYTLTVSSDDVPPQTFDVVVRADKVQHLNITACSTTLDYSCAAATP